MRRCIIYVRSPVMRAYAIVCKAANQEEIGPVRAPLTAFDRGDEMHLALWAYGLEEAHGRYLAIHGHGDVGPQFALIDQPLTNAWVNLFEIIDHLAHGFTSDLDGGFAAGDGLQQRGNIDRRHGQSRCFQMASMMAGGFMGSRSMRTPHA